MQNSKEFKAQISKHSEFLEFLTNKTGIKFDKEIKYVQDMYGVLASNVSIHVDFKLFALFKFQA